MTRCRYICESCGRESTLDAKKAYEQGWDYPPYVGQYGVLGPRTCPKCVITTTVYWKVAIKHVPIQELNDHDIDVIQRIQSEPESLRTDNHGEQTKQ